MALHERAGSAPRRPAPWLLVATIAAAAVAAPALAAALPLQNDAAGPTASDAACGAGRAPSDPACAAGPPAAALAEGQQGASPGLQEPRPPERAAPYASSGYADRPNPSNTTIAASSRPAAGEPLSVVVATTLPLTAAVMRGDGTIGAIEFPDAYEDEADTSVRVLFGGDVTVLSSDPALGAPSHGEAGGNAYTEIGGTLAATPGREYRFEFTVLPAEEGITVIDAAGFLRGAARLVLDVAPAAGRGAAGQPQPAAAPDPPERAGPRGAGPPGGPVSADAARAALEAPRGGAPVPAPAGAAPWIPARSWAGHAGGAGAAPAGHQRAAQPGPEPARTGPGNGSGAADAGAGDLVLYGQIRMDLPYSDSTGPAHGLRVCASDVGADGGSSHVGYEDGTDACTFTNGYGMYVLGPLNNTDPDGDGTGPDLRIEVYSFGGGVLVRNKNATDWLYSENSTTHLRDRAAGNARLDMDVGTPAMNGAARIVDAISDARAFFVKEIGAEIPPVAVYWQHGERIIEAWPGQARVSTSHAYYQAFYSRMFLDGLAAVPTTGDMSESRYVIQHEYGHHAHSHLGGKAEGCKHHFRQKISPGCAFGEGLAYFVPHAVDASPVLREYEDTYVDMERELYRSGNAYYILFDYDNSTDKQTEIQVAGALWDVYDGTAAEVHDRRKTVVNVDNFGDPTGVVFPEGDNLDDLHMGADEIMQIVRDGPQTAEQFYARWERQPGLGSMENIMDLHRMPFNSSDLPAFDAIPAVTVSHAGEAAVPVSAASPPGAETSLSVRQGFDSLLNDGYGGAAMRDNGDGTGTLILNPARADVGENFVVVRADSSGKIELARVNVTVTDPPKWAPVQMNATFDRHLADWIRPGAGWGIVESADPSSPHLESYGSEPHEAYSKFGIDMTAYSSASLELSRYAPQMSPGSYLEAHAWNGTGWQLIEEWGAGEQTIRFETETVALPANLMDVEELGIRFTARGLPANPLHASGMLIDNVVITGTRSAAPAIEAPDDVAAEASPRGGPAAVDLGAPRADPEGLAITREPPWQSFPLGTTEVTWTATDAATGKSDSDTQLVAVLDATPPSVVPPADYTVRAGGAEVTLSANDYCAASATDAVSGVVVLHNATAGPPAGENSVWIADPDPSGGSAAADFPVGNTSTVTWLALDRSGNPGTATQNVTVVRSDAPHIPVSVVRAWADPGSPREPGSAMMLHVDFSHPVALTAAMSGEAPGSLRPSLEMKGGGSAAYASGNGTGRLTFSYTVQPGETAPDYAGTGALGGPCTIRSAADNRGADLELPPRSFPASAPALADGADLMPPRRSFPASAPALADAADLMPPRRSFPASAPAFADGASLGLHERSFPASAPALADGADLMPPRRSFPASAPALVDGASLGPPERSFPASAPAFADAADLEPPERSFPSSAPAFADGASLGPPERSFPASAPALEDAAAMMPPRRSFPASAPALADAAALVPSDPGPPGIPRVVDVTSDAGVGVYGAGRTVGLRVGFSEPVAVSGSPELLLDAGAPGAAATYASGSGTSSLAFEYAVRAADAAADLDYSGTGALKLNGGSISSLHGEAADLALPDPAAEPGLLAGPGRIVVGTKPQVPVGVFSGGPGDPSAEAARLGASAFNGLSAERGYAFFVDASEYSLPAGAGAAAALRGAHDGGRGPALYVGPASDGALHGMAGYAAANGITLVSHSSAARSLAVERDGMYRLEPGAAHMARVLALEIARGGFDAVVPAVQADLYGSAAAGGPSPGYGLLGPLASDLAPLGIPVGRPVEFSGTPGSGAAGSIGAAVLAAGGSGTSRNVAVVYVGSDSALAAIAGNAGAGSPVRERSAWFAAGGAGAGAGSGVAASPLVLSDAAALKMARDTRLAAVQFAVERNSVTDGIDAAVAAATPAASTPAYAAYEAARVIGRALALAGGDPTGAGGHVARAADLDGGPLGRMGVDGSGDLRLPVTYGAWSVSGTAAEWERAPALLRGMDACGIALEKSSLELPALSPGSKSRPARQTITNTGTVPTAAVSIHATDWTQFRDGAPLPAPPLPFSYTEISVGLAGASPREADSAPLEAGTEIPGGTPPGGRVDVDFRINLSDLDRLEADFISQTVTYGVSC